MKLKDEQKKISFQKKKPLKELLLNGPVVSPQQFSNFKKNRKKFDLWRAA
jgi:hypothetical protein